MNIVIARGIAIPRLQSDKRNDKNDSGKPRINRCLRIVHLFEADLNFFLKLQWDTVLAVVAPAVYVSPQSSY